MSLCLILGSINAKSQINWLDSYEMAKTIAKEQNKLIIVDCWATWCGPCLKMDDDVWNNETIIQYADKFIFVKIDLSTGFSSSDFIVKAIPRIFVTDAWNTQMVDYTGYQSKTKMSNVLKNFSFDIARIYSAKKSVKEKTKNADTFLKLAISLYNADSKLYII